MEHVSPVFNARYDIEKRQNDLMEAIAEVNKELQLNRELGIDVQFGPTYADIH